jgi:hypothetical protein
MGQARKELRQGGHFIQGIVSENLFVDLDSVMDTTTTQNNVQDIKEEIHDIPLSYYRLMRKRSVVMGQSLWKEISTRWYLITKISSVEKEKNNSTPSQRRNICDVGKTIKTKRSE